MRSKLLAIQMELKAPKNQKNSHMGFYYRSCEDILESVKPLLLKYNSCLNISDEITEIGGRIYVKSTARISGEGEAIQSTAFAREPEMQKGLNEAQITGLTSSYARKYALNGLFLIDDSEEADEDGNGKPEPKPKGQISKALPKIKSAPDLKTLQTLESFIDKNAWTEDELKDLDLAISAKKGDFK